MNTPAAAASRSTRARSDSSFAPIPTACGAKRYPRASYRLVTSTPKEVEAIGGDELLYLDGKRRGGGYAVIRTRPTRDFAFAVVGSLSDERQAEALAAKYAAGVDDSVLSAQSARAWRRITRGVRLHERRAPRPRTSTRFSPGLRMTR